MKAGLFAKCLSTLLLLVLASSCIPIPTPNILPEAHAEPSDPTFGVTSTGTTNYPNQNNGTINGATWTTGKVGSALNFDGNGYVSVSDSSSLDIIEDMTVEAWIKISVFSGALETIVSKDSDSPRAGALNVDTAQHLTLSVFKIDASYSVIESSSTLETGQWYHVVGVYDYVSDGSSIMRLYINGASAATEVTNAVGPQQTNDQYLGIGIQPIYGGLRFFYGVIDEVKIYNRVLSAGEVSASYNSGNGRGYVDATGLVAYWSFDENAGPKAYDTSNIVWKIKGVKANLPETAALFTKISFFSHTSTGNVRLAVYNSTKHLIWESASTTLSANTWVNVTIEGVTNMPAGDYYLCWQYDNVLRPPSYVAGSSGDGWWKPQNYGAYPSSISGETSTSEKWSIFVTYTTQPVALNLRTKDWSGNVLTQAIVFMNNGTLHNKTVTASGWGNFTGITASSVTVYAKWQNTVVNGSFTVSTTTDRTLDVKCKVWTLTVTAKDQSANTLSNTKLYWTFPNATQVAMATNPASFKTMNGSSYYRIKWQSIWVTANTSYTAVETENAKSVTCNVYKIVDYLVAVDESTCVPPIWSAESRMLRFTADVTGSKTCKVYTGSLGEPEIVTAASVGRDFQYDSTSHILSFEITGSSYVLVEVVWGIVGEVPVTPTEELKLTIQPTALDAVAGTTVTVALPFSFEGTSTIDIVEVQTNATWVQVNETLPKHIGAKAATIQFTVTPPSEGIYTCRITLKAKTATQTATAISYLTVNANPTLPTPSAPASQWILLGLAGLVAGVLLIRGRSKQRQKY